MAPAFPGRMLRGPVEPMQLPSTLAQMTKKRLVSMGRPGPTTISHQPARPVTGWRPAAYWSPVSAWQTRMALLRCSFSMPYVLKATVTPSSTWPHSSVNGSGKLACSCSISGRVSG